MSERMVNVNVRINAAVKEAAEEMFEQMGLNMTTAVNIFLRQSLRQRAIPFEIKLDEFTDETKAAIDEGYALANDKKAHRYQSVDEIKNEFGV